MCSMSKELLLPCPFLSIGVFYSLQDVFNPTQFCYREHSINRHTFYECPLVLLSANGITQCFLPTVTPREHWLCPAVSSPAAQPANPCFNIIAIFWHFLTSRLVLNVFGATEDLGHVSSVWICPSRGCRAAETEGATLGILFCSGDHARTAVTASSGDRLDIPAQTSPRGQSWLCGVQLQKQGLLLVVSVE